MTKNDVPRLCGGTFFTQLLLSRKPTVSQRQRTQGKTDVFHNEDVLFALLQIVQPDSIKPTGNSFETYTTNFKKCDGSIGEDLKFNNESVISSFKNDLAENNPAKLQKMTSFCVDYIDIRETTREHEKLVKRLIELIRDDSSIDDSEMFRVGNNALSVNKKVLPKITEINLADFLLSILSFIVTTERRDNSIGKETIVAWHHNPAVKGRYNGLDGTSIEQDIAVFIPALLEGSTPTEDEAAKKMNTTNNEAESDVADPKRITVNNYGTVQNQKFISIETMNGDINL